MTKARDLADFVSAGNPLADGTISVAEVDGAAPLANPTFSTGIDVTGTVTADGLTVDTDTLFVDAANNRVGIGTISPNSSSRLHVEGGAAEQVQIRVSQSDNTGVHLFSQSSSAGVWNQDNTSMLFATNNTERMRIDSSGNLLVGTTTSASNDFSVQMNGSGGRISSATGANSNSFRFANANTTSQWSFGTNSPGVENAGDYMAIGRLPSGGSWSEALRIDSSGNLLVGKTSVGLANSGVELREGAASGFTRNSTVMDLNRTSSDGQIMRFRKDVSTVGSIGVISDNLYIGGDSAHSSIGFGTNSVYPAYSTGAGNDNDIDLGQYDSRFKDLYLSGGVYLGGTGSANYLDDYEEGTWTPTARSGLSSVVNYESYYTKVGNMVTIWMNATIFGNGTGEQVQISGLPFGHGGGRGDVTPWIDYANFGTDIIPRASVFGGTSYIRLYACKTSVIGSNQISIVGSNINSGGSECNITMSYQTNA